MAKLQVHDSAGVRDFELEGPEVTVGRELDNALRLPDPSVSRHHGVLRLKDGAWEVEDLGSSNGLLVNGDRVQSRRLVDGDRLALGQVRLTFRDPRATPGPPTPPAGTARAASPRPLPPPSSPVAPAPEPALRRFLRWVRGGGR